MFKTRQWTGIVFGMMIGLGLGVVIETKATPRHDSIPEVLQAHEFQVVDRDGTIKIQLGIETDGASRLMLAGPNKKQVIVARVSGRGDALFSLRDRDEQERASLSVSEEKGTVLALTGPGGSAAQPIAALAVLPDSSEALSLLHTQRGNDDKLIRAGTTIYTSGDGKTELRYYGKNGKLHTVSP